MTDALVIQNEKYEKLQLVLIQGNLSKLSPEEKVDYYNRVCDSLGLNPLTNPFDYMVFQGKEKLYANKNCAEQLRSRDKISIQVVSSEIKDDLYIVIVRAISADGRQDEDVASIPIGMLKGLDKANAIMKCMTKAKRRVTLSICGLGMLDESEVDDNPKLFTKSEPLKALEGNKREEPSILPTPTLESIMSKYVGIYKLDRKIEKDSLMKIYESAKELTLSDAEIFIGHQFAEVFGEKITDQKT